MAEDCIFCKIIKGDIPSTKVYEDDKMIAINDVAPAAPVHVLLMPKDHTANITTADPELVAYMLGKVKMIAEKTGIAEKGFRVVINTGDEGGQTVKHSRNWRQSFGLAPMLNLDNACLFLYN